MDENNKESVSANNSSAEEDKLKKSLSDPKKQVKILGITVVVLLAVAAGALLYAFNASDGVQTENADPAETTSTEETEDTEPIATVNTKAPNVVMHLESYSLGENNLTLNLSYEWTGDPESYSSVKAPSYSGTPPYGDYILDESYVVIDSTNRKYQVVKDANGEPLVTDFGDSIGSGYMNDLKDGKIAFFVQVTAPPAGSTADIHIAGSNPITGIVLE